MNKSRMRTAIDVALHLLVAGIFALAFLWVLVNWASGCGETYVTSKGERIEGDCALMPLGPNTLSFVCDDIESHNQQRMWRKTG